MSFTQHPPLRYSALIASAWALFASTLSIEAREVLKLNNTSNLNSAGSWDGTGRGSGGRPNTDDVALFSDVYTQTGNVAVTNSAVEYGGLKVTGSDVNTLITISSKGKTDANWNPLILNSHGIDLSNSPRDLRINYLRVGASQTWNIGANRTLFLGSEDIKDRDGTQQVTVAGAGTLSLGEFNALGLGLNVDGVRVLANFGTSLGGQGKTITLTNGAQAVLTGTGLYENDFKITGSGWTNNLTQSAIGALVLANDAEVGGDITLQGDAVISSAGSSGVISGRILEEATPRAVQFGVAGDASFLTLSGKSTYSGSTTITNALVSITDTGSLGSDSAPTAVTVKSDAALSLAGEIVGDTILEGESSLYAGGISLAGLAVVKGGLALSNTSHVYFDILGATPDLYDTISGLTSLTLDGSLHVFFGSQYTPTAGDSFTLIDFATLSAGSVLDQGYHLDFSLADVSAYDLEWNSQNFSTTGIVSLVSTVAAPEPTRSLLLLVAGMGLTLVRRRQRK